jgi:hypothetical protein
LTSNRTIPDWFKSRTAIPLAVGVKVKTASVPETKLPLKVI